MQAIRPVPETEDPTEEEKEKIRRRKEHEKKFGYMDAVDGMTSVLPQMASWEIPSDVNGSYTGTGIGDKVPVQDADDL